MLQGWARAPLALCCTSTRTHSSALTAHASSTTVRVVVDAAAAYRVTHPTPHSATGVFVVRARHILVTSSLRGRPGGAAAAGGVGGVPMLGGPGGMMMPSIPGGAAGRGRGGFSGAGRGGRPQPDGLLGKTVRVTRGPLKGRLGLVKAIEGEAGAPGAKVRPWVPLECFYGCATAPLCTHRSSCLSKRRTRH